MGRYKYALFDLDGTLTDPYEGLTRGFKYALEKMGVGFVGREELKRFIGPPLHREFKLAYNMSDIEADQTVKLFREYFSVYGWWDNRLYDGVYDMLAAIKNAGVKIALATSKPEIFASKILKLFGIYDCFDFVGAASLDNTRVTKEAVITHVLSSLSIDKRDECVLVGDRFYDAEGAMKCGLDSIGVLYGYGSYDEIVSSGFTFVARSVSEIVKIIV